MKSELYEDLKSAAGEGNKLTNHQWKQLFADEFGVSMSCAKEMLHACLNEKARNERIRRILKKCKGCGQANEWSEVTE